MAFGKPKPWMLKPKHATCPNFSSKKNGPTDIMDHNRSYRCVQNPQKDTFTVSPADATPQPRNPAPPASAPTMFLFISIPTWRIHQKNSCPRCFSWFLIHIYIYIIYIYIYHIYIYHIYIYIYMCIISIWVCLRFPNNLIV